jgi:glycosyltransferase involved in cell wall biosynthesis
MTRVADQRPSLVYLGPVEWDGLRQRPQREALLLSEDFRVTYVNPVAARSFSRGDWRRAISWFRGRRRARTEPGVRVLGFLHWPGVGPLADALNAFFFSWQISRRIPAEPGYTLVVTTPSLLALTMIRLRRPGRLVYSCMDNFPAFHRGEAAERMRRFEEEMLPRCQTVVVPSRELFERMSSRHPRVVLSPNGAEIERFAAVRREPGPSRPVLGYCGTIGNWVDFDLLERLADRFSAAEVLLAGPWTAPGGKRLLAKPNVRWLGERPSGEIPRIMASFDVGLIPFEVNDLTVCVNPIKLYEYLAAGIPVVSTAIPEAEPHRPFVNVAGDGEAFLQAVGKLLAAGPSPVSGREARRRYAAGFSWEKMLAPLRAECSLNGTSGRP